MTPQQYLEELLAKYNLDEGQVTNLKQRRAQVENRLRDRFGAKIENVYYSGSYAKKTAINLSFDLDICIYFRSDAFAALRDMYSSVLEALRSSGLAADPQTVSIHVNLGGNDLDVVPARSLGDGKGNASLYVRDRDTSLQTNIPAHVDFISKSEARPVIKLMKVWRHRHGIHFKSFALELLVIKALEGTPASAGLSAQLFKALEFARDHAVDARLVDPANTNNVVSDLIPTSEKQNMARQAGASAGKQKWEEIVW